MLMIKKLLVSRKVFLAIINDQICCKLPFYENYIELLQPYLYS